MNPYVRKHSNVQGKNMTRQSSEAKQELDLNVSKKTHSAMSRVRDVSLRLGNKESSLLRDVSFRQAQQSLAFFLEDYSQKVHTQLCTSEPPAGSSHDQLLK